MSAPRGNRGRGRGRGRGRNNRGGRGAQDEMSEPPAQDRTEATNNTVQLLQDFLTRRYDAPNKLLNLSHIAADEEIRKSGMFDRESTQLKFFPALMIICADLLPTREEKEAAIHSVTLAGNNLPSIRVIRDLASTLPHIRNLDLTGNAFESVGVLKPWKGRFRLLEQLLVDPFAGEAWEEELVAWFPKLGMLNGRCVRAGAEANANANAALPSVVQSPGQVMGQPSTAEDQQKEEMVAYVQQATNLKRDYAIQCLEAGGWNLNKAGELFTQSRETLPADAFH